MKFFSKVGDHLFNLIEGYFEGKPLNEEFPSAPDPVDGHCTVWNLEQGVEDIIINDLIGSFRFILPAIVRRKVQKIYRKACLFFLVDAIIEDETIDADPVSKNLLTHSYTINEKWIALDPVVKESINSRIISLQDWFKTKVRIVRNHIRRLRKDNKPYYLLGDFVPSNNDLYAPVMKLATERRDKVNFTRTYIFNKRN